VAISSPNVDPELIEYARQSGKPLLEYPGEENYVEAYKAFYTSL
jgi:starch synthase